MKKALSAELYEWTENKGQWDSSILFRAQQNALDLQIGKNFISYYFYNPAEIAALSKHHQNTNNLAHVLNVHGLRLNFLNSQNATPFLNQAQKHYYNFYQGNKPKNWVHGARASTEIGLNQLYPGIQLQVHAGKNQLKYEFWLEPNAKLNAIQLEVLGATKMYIEYGDLYLETPFATIKEQRPFAYQIIDKKQIQVGINYQINGNTISFVADESYNSAYPLVIDPEIVFLTYSGASVDNFGFTATPGENGSMYAGGISTGPYITIPSGIYPATSNAFQITYAGGGASAGDLADFPCDITFSKYSPDGTTLLYATYLGGSNNELPNSLVIDDSSNLLLLGNTFSTNFPVSSAAYDQSANGNTDFVITKFDKNGQLIASTYLGGSANDALNYNLVTNYFYGDGYRGDITTDSIGNIYATGVTQSSNFPTTTGCLQNNLKGFQDGVVFCLNPSLSNLKWSTYIGGDSIDALYSIDLSKNKGIFLSGGTQSPNFPGTAGHYQAVYGGGQTDGIICNLDYTGKTMLHASYFGTNAYDQIFSLDLDKDNLVYVVGQSLGNIPISPGVYNNPKAHQFLACLNPDLSTKIWSTVFGSARPNVDLTINAFLVDECKRIYISSWGGNDANKFNSSTSGLTITADAFQSTTDGSDFYLMLLNKNASSLLYATYIGGDDPNNSGDHVDGGTSRFDKQGIVYQSMCASCPNNLPPSPLSDLKTTANSFSPKNQSPRCSNAALKFDFRVNNANFVWEADTCASVFSFKNKTQNASNFYWTFPNGDSSYEENPKKFIASKYYGDSIRLIVEFGTNCADTAYGSVSLPDSLDHLNIPNVFTPNGDGKNDDFKIEGVSGQCNETDIYIYNRWGQLYFSDKVSYFKWDGKDNKGQEAPEGVYFFLLHTKKLNTGQEDDVHGTITLIR